MRKEENILESWKRKILKKIYKSKWHNGTWRRMSHALRTMFKELSIIMYLECMIDTKVLEEKLEYREHKSIEATA